MPISHKHKAIFVHIPKTGGQSVSEMLGINKGDLKGYYGHENPGKTPHGGLVLTHLTIKQIKARFDVTGFYLFSFVRNPYTRIISEYSFRMKNISVFKEPTGTFMPFADYCELLLSRWEGIMSGDDSIKHITDIQHVIPQSEYVDPDVDIYRFEKFEDECKRIQDIIGISKFIPKVNTGSYKIQHTARTIDITNKLYAKDFENYGYNYL